MTLLAADTVPVTPSGFHTHGLSDPGKRRGRGGARPSAFTEGMWAGGRGERGWALLPATPRAGRSPLVRAESGSAVRVGGSGRFTEPLGRKPSRSHGKPVLLTFGLKKSLTPV